MTSFGPLRDFRINSWVMPEDGWLWTVQKTKVGSPDTKTLITCSTLGSCVTLSEPLTFSGPHPQKNSIYWIYWACTMLDKIFHVLTHLILRGRYDDTHFIDEQTERDEEFCPSYVAETGLDAPFTHGLEWRRFKMTVKTFQRGWMCSWLSLLYF